MLDMWGPDVSNISGRSALKQLAVVSLGLGGFGYLVYKYHPKSPAVPREYPFDGLVKELGGLEENKVHTSHYSSLVYINGLTRGFTGS